MRKHWKTTAVDEEELIELQELLDLHPVFCQLLLQRGIKTQLDAQHFFTPSISKSHSPFLLKDMDIALQRLTTAIEQGEAILLYGDYDVDGTSAVALMYSFLSTFHERLDYYIPDRYKEGYGVSMAGIDYAKQNGIDLIITLDCGIKAMEPIEQAKTHGIDVIICDHHLPQSTLPDAIAILDPKRPDCNYPYKDLCGTGVAFKLVQAYALAQGLPAKDTEHLLDFLAIATTCDIVPLMGENRIFTHFGLQKINKAPRVGVKALIEQSNRKATLKVSDLVFGIGPMINAAGRLADAKQAVRLLLAEDPSTARQVAIDLSKSNELRKEYDRNMVKEAGILLEQQQDWEQQRSIVLYQPHWHKGVVGIAASRMVDVYHKPSIILTKSEGKIVGSARSVPGFDIHDAIQECADLMVNFGGHKYAAGLTLLPKDLDAFRARFEKVVAEKIQPKNLRAEIPITAELALGAINMDFYKLLQRFAPFGPGNRNPVFCSKGVEDTGYSRVLKDKHLKLQIRQKDSTPLSGIAFNLGHTIDIVQQGPFDICYTIEENHWMGKTTLQLNIKDLRVSG